MSKGLKYNAVKKSWVLQRKHPAGASLQNKGRRTVGLLIKRATGMIPVAQVGDQVFNGPAFRLSAPRLLLGLGLVFTVVAFVVRIVAFVRIIPVFEVGGIGPVEERIV